MASDIEGLMALKDLLSKTGILHEGLTLQLRYYPLIVTHCVKCEINFSFEDKLVVYKLLKFKGQPPKNIKKRFNLLIQWVKTLLGDEYNVVIQGFDLKEPNGRSRVKKQIVGSRRRAKRNRK